MADYAIEASRLIREFKKGPRAVDGIDVAVAPGEIYGFLGPNGAGKSTTVHVLTTLLPPTAGSARVGGFDVVHQGPKVRTVMVRRCKRLRSIHCSPAASICVCSQRFRHSRAKDASHAQTSCSRGLGSPKQPTARSAATREA